MPRDRSSLIFVIAFAVIGAGFLGSTIYAETRYSAIDAEVSHVTKNSMPSVAHLVAARGALRHLEVAAERFARSSTGGRSAVAKSLFDARNELDRDIQEERSTPDYPGEHQMAATAEGDVAQLEAMLDGWVATPPDEGEVADVRIHAAVDRADEAIDEWIGLNAAAGQAGVSKIIDIRRDSVALALALDSACMALTIAAAAVALRALRKRRDAEETNARLLTERADELEIFANRVAHDLLSPLSSLTYCLHAFKSVSAEDPNLSEALRRARACVARAQTMVDGIFEFARAGAHPTSTGHADVREVVDSVAEEVRGAETGAEVVVEPFEHAAVACSPGVLMSVVANLVRNAVKFTSDSSLARVTVRVENDRDSVRVEVEDTGPGVPEGMEERIFDPYVRAEGVTQAGLGLGLATVKRLCEAHRGRVGVRSTLGRGSTFWFTLPRANA